MLGLVIVGAWLYYTVNAVRGSTTRLCRSRYTNLRELTTDAMAGLSEASESLERYVRAGEGYDLSRHYAGRTALKTALGAINRHPLTEGGTGDLKSAESAAEVYGLAADKAIALRASAAPGEYSAVRDNEAAPAAAKLRDSLDALELIFGRHQSFAEQQLKGERDAATTALVVPRRSHSRRTRWLLADVNRRILSPCAAASRALQGSSSAGGSGAPLRHLARRRSASSAPLQRGWRASTASARALSEARDIEGSVNAVLAAAATINDLAGSVPACSRRSSRVPAG